MWVVRGQQGSGVPMPTPRSPQGHPVAAFPEHTGPNHSSAQTETKGDPRALASGVHGAGQGPRCSKKKPSSDGSNPLQMINRYIYLLSK